MAAELDAALVAEITACRDVVEDYAKRIDEAAVEYCTTKKYVFPNLSRAEDEEVERQCGIAVARLTQVIPDALEQWTRIKYPREQYDQQIERMRDYWIRRRNLLRSFAKALTVRWELGQHREQASVVHHHHAGDNFTTTFSNSKVGAAAIGANSTAKGKVSVQMGKRVSQQQYDQQIKAAQKALVDDQDRLEELSSGLYEALGQFLRVARQIQVDQASFVDVQAKMKETLDEVWAEQVAKRLNGQTIPTTLEFAKTLLSSPVTATVAKAWLGA